MKRQIFEDSDMSDMQGQATGGGSNGTSGGVTSLQPHLGPINSEIDPSSQNKLYPIEGIDQAISDAFINISNVSKLIDTAKQNPALASSRADIKRLELNIKDIIDKIVDFDEIISIIKKDDR